MATDPRFEDRQAVARWRLDVIRAVVAKPKGSAERRALLEAVAAQHHRAPDGQMRPIGRATLYAWVSAYDAEGLMGLLPDVRKDKGTRRVLVSTAWDGFFAGRISDADHRGVAEALTGHIRSLWASGEAGWRAICEKSTTRLIEISRGLRDVAFDGLVLGRLGDRGPSQFGICDVNRRLAEAQRSYGIIAIRNKDNARFQDAIAPTIRRDFTLLKPREIVVGDVHPMDIMVLRPDGSRAYPKAISWFDPATGEVHMTVVLLEPSEGVRREHVAMAFEAMVNEWGLPKLLYLDNGSEYSWVDMINGFTQLSKLAGLTVKENSLADARVTEAKEAVIRSIAYNAKGKPGIEGLFGNLERVFFSNVPGWTAGDRMRKKTHAKGRDPVAFPGDMAAFFDTIRTHLDHYHKRPQNGRLAGRSPNEALRSHIEAGWGKVVLARPEVLALAFSTEETRVVDRGTVAFTPRHGRSQRYYCEALLGLLPGTQITIRVPAYDPRYLFCFDDAGEMIGIAHPEQMYHPLDPAGAIEGPRNKIVTLLEEYFTTGLTREALARRLAEDFAGVSENTLHHWRSVANTLATRTREIGRVSAYERAGIDAVQIKAILDPKTTNVCRHLHGRVIPVPVLRGQAEAWMEASSRGNKPAAFKAWKFHGDDDDLSATPTADLQGVGMPPYHHGNCRTVTVAYFGDAAGDLGRWRRAMQDREVLPKADVAKIIDKAKAATWAEGAEGSVARGHFTDHGALIDAANLSQYNDSIGENIRRAGRDVWLSQRNGNMRALFVRAIPRTTSKGKVKDGVLVTVVDIENGKIVSHHWREKLGREKDEIAPVKQGGHGIMKGVLAWIMS